MAEANFELPEGRVERVKVFAPLDRLRGLIPFESVEIACVVVEVPGSGLHQGVSFARREVFKGEAMSELDLHAESLASRSATARPDLVPIRPIFAADCA
jgi:hypothetical protein